MKFIEGEQINDVGVPGGQLGLCLHLRHQVLEVKGTEKSPLHQEEAKADSIPHESRLRLGDSTVVCQGCGAGDGSREGEWVNQGSAWERERQWMSG